jgi:hypothetical protein
MLSLTLRSCPLKPPNYGLKLLLQIDGKLKN